MNDDDDDDDDDDEDDSISSGNYDNDVELNKGKENLRSN